MEIKFPINFLSGEGGNKIVRLKVATAAVLCTLGFCLTGAHAWQSDNGDGTFTNPPLYADYPDPDIIRVGDDFYMASTTFVQSPGINILHSQDLVNWEIVSHVAPNLDGGDSYNMVGGTAYCGGLWAPSIRYRSGTFYVVVNPTFANARVYYTTHIAGPWQYHQLNRSAYDPGFFIDTDGTGYVVCGGGSQTLLTLNSDYSQVVSATTGFLNSGGEGSHMVKRGNYYYVFNAKPSVWPFQLLCSRSTNIFGPYETIECLNELTGGHQGAIVDMPDGSDYGFVMRDSGAIGRMTYISPIFWANNRPVWGTPAAPGQVPAIATKPIQGKPVMRPATSDDFSSSTLGLQWLWNHNPDDTRWSLTERPGFLRLKPTQATGFWRARNTLTQKGQGPQSSGVVKFDLSNLQSGDICGFGSLGKHNGHIYVTADGSGKEFLGMEVVINKGATETVDTRVTSVPFTGTTLYLRTDLDFEENRAICSYSDDGTSWTTLGGEYTLEWGWGAKGTFQGDQFAISCYNPHTSTGYVDVDSFTFEATAGLAGLSRGRPRLNSAGTTFVADTGHLLRGPFATTEWGSPPQLADIQAIKNKGCNAIHLYAECFDSGYAAGAHADWVDQMVQMTRDNGLYLVMTIGNGANNGVFNAQFLTDFWTFYAPRYKDEAHVLYEIQNEPFAWGPPYDQATLDMEADAYTLIRSLAPDTLILLFTFAVLADGPAALADIQSVSTAANIDWTKTAMAFHGYAGHAATATAVQQILNAGYPCFMTEFYAHPWGDGSHTSQGTELTAHLERMGISWLSFLHISHEFKDDTRYVNRVDFAGLSWIPDFGSWPASRGVYGNSGNPRATTGLSGTLRIQAEDFDTGGQGVAYSDTDASNSGGQYRASEGVDIESTADTGGGYDIGWTGTGEWLEYTILVTEPGLHNLSLRVASPLGGAVQVFCNGTDMTGIWTVPNTGGWQTWTTVIKQVNLEYGRQKLRIEIPTGRFNLNWIDLSPATTGAIPNGTYKMLNRNSGKALEGLTADRSVVQNSYSGATSQQWTLQHLGASQYKITSAANGWSWSVFYTSNGDSLDFVWWWNLDATGQRYIITLADSGYYRLTPVRGGLSVEIAGASSTDGAKAQQYQYLGAGNQQWGFLAPSASAFPTGLSATAPSSTQIDLTWNAVTGATGYNVKRSTTSGGPYTTIATGVVTTNYSESGLTEGTKYYYVVSAVTANGESLNGLEGSAARLHAHLAFDEARGTTAADSTGNGWTGTLVKGPLWTTGKYGNAVGLDGANDHVSLPSGVVSGLADFSVATWVYLDAVSKWSRVFDFGTDTTVNMFLTPCNGSTGAVRFAITTRGSGGEQRINGSAALPAGAWTHVAVTLRSGTGILYVNGVEVGRNSAMTLTPDALGVTTRNYIGRSQYSDPYLDGRVDDFRIYSDALSASDIAALAENPGDATE